MIIFRKSDQKQTLKVLRVQNCYIGNNKKEEDLSSMTAPQLSVDTVNKSSSNINIPQTPEIVKGDSKKIKTA